MSSFHPAVVLVDDELPFIEALACMLRAHLACPVHTFARPRAALAALDTLAPAIVVTDYCMPELDGIEFIRMAAQAHPRLPFILISGHLLDPSALKIRPAAALRAVLPKPFGWRALADEILRHAPELGRAEPSVAAPRRATANRRRR